jgi:hypothetical protein
MRTTIPPGARKLLRASAALCLLLMLFVWLGVSFRLLSFFLGVFIVCAWWLSRLRGRMRVLIAVWCAVSISPVELGLKNVPGPPRLVQYSYGLPSARGRERIARGDIVWGGCMRPAFGAKWMIVW